MPSKNLLLTTVRSKVASRDVIPSGSTISTAAETRYLLQMSDERTVRDNMIVKRVGPDLQVFVDGIDEPNLTLENFYGEGINAQLCNVDTDGQIHAYALTDGPGSDGHPTLADGESAALFLGGPALGVLPEISASTDHAAALPLWPYLAGAAAIGVAGTAYHRHREDNGSHHASSSDLPPRGISIDTTPPALPSEWNADRNGVSGKAETGCTVVIYHNGMKRSEVETDEHGDWHYTIGEYLGQGTHRFAVEVVDKAGNSSGQTEPIEFVLPPWSGTAHIAQLIDNVGSIQGEIAPDGLTNDPRPQIAGQSSIGTHLVLIYDGATLLGSTTTQPDGTWSFQPTTDLSEGAHSLTVETYGEGYDGGMPSPAWNFIVDTTPPAPVTQWSESPEGLQGMAEANSTLLIYSDEMKLAEVHADDIGNWSYTPANPLELGKSQYAIEVIDKAGNSSGLENLVIYSLPDLALATSIDCRHSTIQGSAEALEATHTSSTGVATPDAGNADARGSLVLQDLLSDSQPLLFPTTVDKSATEEGYQAAKSDTFFAISSSSMSAELWQQNMAITLA